MRQLIRILALVRFFFFFFKAMRKFRHCLMRNNRWRRIDYTIRMLNITLLLSSRRGHLFKLKSGA